MTGRPLVNAVDIPTIDLNHLHLLAAALCSAERGWPVIPLHPGTKRPAGHPERSCPGTGRCASGHRTPEQRATLAPELIQAAWVQRPYNVGIATGPAGLLVVDLDVCKPEEEEGAPDGAASLRALCERTGQTLPATYRVRTPSGGCHLYFTAPPGGRLKNSAGRLGPHIDTRAWGGYVVAPGSTTPQGTYEVTDNSPLAPLPPWVAALLVEPSRPATVSAPLLIPGQGTRRAEVALERETAALRQTKEGGRNTRLLAGARALGRFVAWGEITRNRVEEAFQGAGEAAGLSPVECRATIRSALEWSIRTARPREAA
ncbi:bifunctional DNA primase/polymerase [Streptomyces caniscabiei]|uniref:bifunctional DNA primase/polymerase n=1 Tax=Streptomyces caniscabiei TaxID=2746961 RepID=UPI0029B2179C|nr:bifunctional DNA primase/polymerase [Streptomyces caniscabiei]MDX2601607.1 bifunctional DNA primase/polymerase [Streptomyces caniscabiei]MDX2741815.1 bifunctional DNA primase/polymerase [Streptomyces caniscabiei]MDX2781549.1 bifunctional DNA primase/polymerase [Streptomyces caniscabiei]